MRHPLCFLFLLGGFGLASAQNPTTFKVDLSVKIAEGFFTPGVDRVDARGSFNNWTAFTLTDDDADEIYEGTFDFADTSIGTTIDYKFVVVKGGADNWELDPNRSFVVSAAGGSLPVVYFDRDSVVSVQINAAVSFTVDLNVQIATGRFDPATDEVYVRGSSMGWGEPPQGAQLSPDPARAGVYVGTYLVGNIFTGAASEYKYTIWRPGTRETVWEGGENKRFMLDGSEPDSDSDTYLEKSVGLTFFDGLTFNDVLPADTEVTFRVNMNGATRFNGSAFDPQNEGVWINGAFLNWWTWNSQPAGNQLFDDGTNGDEVAGDGIYSWKRLFRSGDAKKLEYKYGIQSGDNEAAFANNHIRYIEQTGTYVLPVDTFGTMFKEPAPVGALSIRLVSGTGGKKVALSWNGGTGIRLERSAALPSTTWTVVAGSEGLSGMELPAGSGNEFFRLVRP